MDLGAGNGILGIGALLLGAPRAVFVEAQGCLGRLQTELGAGLVALMLVLVILLVSGGSCGS